MQRPWFRHLVFTLLLVGLAAGCNKSTGSAITITGSDTMVSLGGKWAGAYSDSHPGAVIEVSGGGTGAGMAGLMSQTVQIAAASHQIPAQDKQRIRDATGKEPTEFAVALDALAVFVHSQNPVNSLTFEQLAEIYGDGGKFNKWSDVDPAFGDTPIVNLGRESNSGTYQFFHEHVVGKERRFKSTTSEQSGSKDIVNLVATTAGAIGYAGLGYVTPEVKALALAAKPGDAPVAPSVATAVDGTYPLARPLYLYTLGEPEGAVKDFIEWVLSPAGQQVVAEAKFVPLPQK